MRTISGDPLEEILSRVEVSDDGLHALVDGHSVDVDMPVEMRSALTNVVYQRLHCGNAAEQLPVRVRNPELEKRIVDRLGTRVERATVEPALVLADSPEHIVVLDGVRVRVPEERVSERTDSGALVIELSRVRPMLSPGFLLVTGERPSDPITRVYVRGESAARHADLFADVVELLEERRMPFRAKVLTMPGQYPRNDAIVLYLSEPSDTFLKDLVSMVDDREVADIVSPFTLRIGRGVSLAAEPRPDGSGVVRSFGEHRAETLARALLSTRGRAGAVRDHVAAFLSEAGIDPARPYFDLPPVSAGGLADERR